MQIVTTKLNTLLLVAFVLIFTACRTDRSTEDLRQTQEAAGSENARAKMAKRAFKASFSTWYRFHPLEQPQPVAVGGTAYLGIIAIPGGGEGQATHLGKASTLFNQTGYVLPPDFSTVLGTVAAPVMSIATYPVSGTPLPMIQNGDFNGISPLLATLQVPTMVGAFPVSTLIYNKKNEALFLSVVSGSQTAIQGTTATINGKVLIVGGTAKFQGATGELTYVITFDIANPNDASYTLEGWIQY
ncbi:hypothetical protein HRH25_23075 [Flavisolibacter sp. BT320]|nr:hypothetical protein [Flavisolibacter longurius]